MDLKTFEAGLKSDGFQQIETKAIAAGTHNSEHGHPFEVRALVIDGRISLTVAGVSSTYEKGQVFTMATHCPHAEQIGPEGVSYVVGRRPGTKG